MALHRTGFFIFVLFFLTPGRTPHPCLAQTAQNQPEPTVETAVRDSPEASGQNEPRVLSGPIDLAVGDLRLSYQTGSGLWLWAHGIPILTRSSILSVVPGWTKVFYNSQRNMTLLNGYTVEEHDGGKRITLEHRLAEEYGSPFHARETISLYPDNRMEVRLDFRFDGAEPALLEWRAGGLNPGLAAGATVEITDSRGERPAAIPFEAPGAGMAESTVAREFDRLRISSPIGTVIIESDSGNDMILFDYRKNRFADEANPIFWLGFLERPIPRGTDMSYRYAIHFPEGLFPLARAGTSIDARVELVPAATARRAAEPRRHIIPTPKESRFTGNYFPLNAETTIHLGPAPGKGIEDAASFLLRELEEFHGISPMVVRSSTGAGLPANAIIMGEPPRFSKTAEALLEAGLELPKHPGGYALLADEDRVLIGGRTEQGVFYGVTTLLQLIEPDNGRTVVRGARIVDYPSLDFRGVHALAGKNAGKQISRAVRDLMARHKMNAFVWQCQYLNWDAAPEIHHPELGMEKEDAQQVIETAASHFVEIIPLIPTLGHVRWMFTNDQNLDLAEDPETPHAYQVTNPRTYEFLFPILREAVDFFNPRFFHIGHDEIDMWGRFPHRSAEFGLTPTELIERNISKLHGWFGEKDIRVMIWGDMFLHREEAADATFAPTMEEARLRRSLLPHDVIITDWHYEVVPPEGYTSIPIWMEGGFQTIGASWDDPMNIRNLALAAVRAGAHGLLQTTWAGFQFEIDHNEREWHQYWAYLTAAHYAWSGDQRLPEDLPFNPRDAFLDTWFRSSMAESGSPGFFIDLGPVYNRPLGDADGEGWLGKGPNKDFRQLAEDGLKNHRTLFHLPTRPDQPGALLMAGLLNPVGSFPEAVTLRTEPFLASHLHFLLTGSHRSEEGREAGVIEMVFEDGSSEIKPLVFGKGIFAYDQNRAGRNSRVAWEGISKAGTPLRAWDLCWTNPRPKEKIHAIRIRSDVTETSPILLAITGVLQDDNPTR